MQMSKPYCCGSAEVTTYIPAPYVMFLNSALKASEQNRSQDLASAAFPNQPRSLVVPSKITVPLVKLNLRLRQKLCRNTGHQMGKLRLNALMSMSEVYLRYQVFLAWESVWRAEPSSMLADLYRRVWSSDFSTSTLHSVSFWLHQTFVCSVL